MRSKRLYTSSVFYVSDFSTNILSQSHIKARGTKKEKRRGESWNAIEVLRDLDYILKVYRVHPPRGGGGGGQIILKHFKSMHACMSFAYECNACM